MIPSALDLPHTVVLPAVGGLAAHSPEALETLQRQLAAIDRQVQMRSAAVAAEVARRSAPGLGHAGLAAHEGARTPERLIERWAGVTPDTARAMVQIGELMQSDAPHARVVVDAISAGDLSIHAAEAIRSGLGDATQTVSEESLVDAAQFLVALAPDLPVRRVGAEARALRDALDTASAQEREALLREKRFLRLSPQADGMTRVTGLLDPESAAIVGSAFEQITAPRRGGPRFVDPTAAARSKTIIDDPRTTDQLLADAFVEMVRIAGAADDRRVFAQRRPAVQIHVDVADLRAGVGAADIEGQAAPVSIATAQRFACSAGAIPILFDGAQVLDVGRAQRLYTDRQRTGMAARDGGCTVGDCDRPPSWCEAHHIDEWKRDDGRTDVARGVLLCRFHHRWVHDGGWRIVARDGGFTAVPPPRSSQPEVPLRSRNVTGERQRYRRAREAVAEPTG